MLPGVSFRDRYQANWLAARMILPAWFDHVVKRFSYKEVQFKMFCLPVKTSCPLAEDVTENLVLHVHFKCSRPFHCSPLYYTTPKYHNLWYRIQWSDLSLLVPIYIYLHVGRKRHCIYKYLPKKKKSKSSSQDKILLLHSFCLYILVQVCKIKYMVSSFIALNFCYQQS